MSQGSGRQVTGEAMAGLGAEKGRQFAEDKDMGQLGTLVMTMLGGMGGEMTTGAITGLTELASNLMSTKNMSMDDAVQEAIRQSYGRGEVRFTDIEARSSREQALQDWVRATSKSDIPMNRQRQQLIRDFAADAGVSTDDYYAREITDDFWNTRLEEVSELKGRKNELLDRLSQGRTPEVQVQNTIQAIDDEIARLTRLGEGRYKDIRDRVPSWREAVETGDEQLLRDEMHGISLMDVPGIDDIGLKLEGWANAIAEGRIPPNFEKELIEISSTGANAYKPIINELSNWREIARNKNLSELESIRHNWGEVFSGDDFKPVKGEGDKVYNSVYGALKEDMGDHIMSTGTQADYTNWQNADVRLAQMAEEFNSGTLKNLLNDSGADPSKIMQFVRNEDKEITETLYKQLSPFGQTRMRAAITADAVNAATGTGKIINANNFADHVRNHSAQKGILMSNDDTSQVEGLLRYLEQTAGSQGGISPGDAMPGKNIPGGRYAWARLIFSNPAMGLPLIVGGGLTLGGVAKALESPPARDILIKYGQIPEKELSGGRAGELVKRIREIISATASTETSGRETQQIERSVR
jgi:hypothetical protein